MIQINLLDQPGAKTTKVSSAAGSAFSAPAKPSGSPAVTVVVLLLAGVLLVVNAGAAYFAYSNVLQSENSLEQVKNSQKKLKDEIAHKMSQAEQIRHYREVVSNQMDVLRSLDPPNRILWCEKINELSDLMPPKVFLSEIKVTENSKMVETQQSKDARANWEKSPKKSKLPPPPVVQKPVISYDVFVTGLALGRDNVEQMKNVTAFHKALIENSGVDASGKPIHFMDGFNDNIEFESLEATLYEGTPVNKFVFKLTTKPSGEDSPSTGEKPAASASAGASQFSLHGRALASN